MADKVFVDTNILLRATFSEMEGHADARALLREYITQAYELWISAQVVREFMVQATHVNTLSNPKTIEAIATEIGAFELLFRIADDTQEVRHSLIRTVERYDVRGKQIHDANIIATMLANDIGTLLTLNASDMKRYADRIAVVSSRQANV